MISHKGMKKNIHKGLLCTRDIGSHISRAHAMHPLPALQQRGFTLLELLICLALATIIMLGLSDIISTSLATRRLVHAENDSALQAEFAMDRIRRMVRGSRRLILPMSDNPATAWNESRRDVLAITLPAIIDLDFDDTPDADNDGDGLLDEDLPGDNDNNGEAGIIGIDDDGDGSVDESDSLEPYNDNDENNLQSDDWVDGLDNDDDGSIDEDMHQDMNKDFAPGIEGIDDDNDGAKDEGHMADDDEDGTTNEDWFDPVVFYLAGTTLVERLPVPWDENGDFLVTGKDYVENPLAENVSRFEVTKTITASDAVQLITIELELTGAGAEPYTLEATIRVGGAI